MSNFLEQNRKIRESLDTISRMLNNKADALFTIGLQDLGSFCSQNAQRLDAIQEEIENMVDDEFNRSLKQAQDSSTNVLQAVLSGIDLATETDE